MSEAKAKVVHLPQNEVVSLAPRTLAEAMEFAQMLSKSDFVPNQFKGKPGDIVAAIQFGAEVGVSPMQALQNIAVINGRPCMWGDLVLGLVQKSGLLTDFHEENQTGNTAICVSIRKGGRKVETRFSMDDAKRAGLLGKQGPWQQYPKRMLQMRARAFNLRDNFPDVLKGLMVREEVVDYTDVSPLAEAEVEQRITAAFETPADKTVEIVADQVEPKPTAPPPRDESPINKQDWRDLIEQGAMAGVEPTDLEDTILEKYGHEHWKHLRKWQAAELDDELRQRFEQQGAGK